MDIDTYLKMGYLYHLIDKDNGATKKKMRNVIKRSDNRYMTYAKLAAGRKAVYGHTAQEAAAKAEQLEQEERQETATEQYAFQTVYRRWFLFKLGFVRAQTMDRVEVTYNRYYKESKIEKDDVRNLTTLYVIEFLNSLITEDMTYKEFQRIYQIVNNVYNYAIDTVDSDLKPIDWERVRRNIPKHRFVKSRKKETAVSEQEKELLQQGVTAGKVCCSKYSAALCLVLNFSLGLRIGELAALKWSDIDWIAKTVSVKSTMVKQQERINGERTGRMIYADSKTTKTRNGLREIPLTDSALELLQILRKHHLKCGYESPYLCYDGVDGVVMVRVLDRTLRKMCKELGLETINSHLIRKTFATDLHNAGVPTKLISDLLGHADIITTERNYIISQQDETEKVRQMLNQALTAKQNA